MARNNITTIRKPEAGYYMTVTKSHNLLMAVQKFTRKFDDIPRSIWPLCGGKYFQLSADEPVTEGGK